MHDVILERNFNHTAQVRRRIEKKMAIFTRKTKTNKQTNEQKKQNKEQPEK